MRKLTRGTIAYPLALGVVAALATGCGEPPRQEWVGPAPSTAGPPPATTGAAPVAPVPPPTTAGTAAPPGASAGRNPRRASPSAASDRAADRRYVFPVKAGNVAYHPTHAAYPATDIFADCGTPVVAVTDGTVLEVSRVDRYRKDGPQGPLNGGLSVSLLGSDGVRYYGSHLTVVNPGIEPGVRVRAGQRLGTVGRTGNANNVCHLHFGISPPCARTGDWKVRRGVVWPASFLDSWRADGRRSPVAKVVAWRDRTGCAA